MRRPPLAVLLVAAAALLAGAPGAAAARPELELSPDAVTASAGARVTLTVLLDEPLPGGAIVVRLPEAFGRTGPGGLRATRPPRAAGRGRVERRGGEVVMPLEHGELRRALSIEDAGLPAGTYRLTVHLRDAAGRERRAGAVHLGVVPPERESELGPGEWSRLPSGREALNATSDGEQQAEAFVGADPGDPSRVLALANGEEGLVGAWSADGGDTWARRPFPAFAQASATQTEAARAVCDPVAAADAAGGSIWFGGINRCDAGADPHRVVLARLDTATGEVDPFGVRLPDRGSSTASNDKPMIAFDAERRRLYATWVDFDRADDPEATVDGGTFVVASWCDAGPPAERGERCLDPLSWTTPVTVTAVRGSYTYPDVAIAPGGDVHVVWWDYSHVNAVAGATCAAPCEGLFSEARPVALLDATGGPLPFGCPIPVAPGGRVGAAPNVEADRDGRVWVAWGDLRPDSGSRRCQPLPSPDGRFVTYTPPTQDQLSWDVFATWRDGALPGAALPSAKLGTRLVADGDEGFAAQTDDFLPWLAVDAATGEAWAAFYSTGADRLRHSAHFYGAALAAGPDGRTFVGPANRLSALPSSHHSVDETGAYTDCCAFQDDFGDYAGAVAAQGRVIASWADNSTGDGGLFDGEAFVFRGALATVGFDLADAVAKEIEGADGDGRAERGETLALQPVVRNTGTRTAVGEAGPRPVATLSATGRGLTVVDAQSELPALAPGQAAPLDEPFRVRVDEGHDCAAPAGLVVTVRSAPGTEAFALPLAVDCPPVVAPAPAPSPTATPAPPAAVPVRLTSLRVPAGQRVRTVARRGLRVRVRCNAACSVRVAITGREPRRARLPRRLARRTVRTLSAAARHVRVRLTSRAHRALLRRPARRLRRVRVSVSARAAGPGVTAGRTLRRSASLRR